MVPGDPDDPKEFETLRVFTEKQKEMQDLLENQTEILEALLEIGVVASPVS
jgi:hypothetical protein